MAGMVGFGRRIIETPPTSKTWPGGLSVSHQSLPTDPVFIANVTIQNAIIGASYILLGPDGTTVLAGPGTIATDPEVLSNISAFDNPYIMELRLRKSSPGSTRYKPLNQFAPHSATGVSIYVVQIESSVLD